MMRVTAFRWIPPFAQGLARDLRVRWALEEAGVPYETRLIGREDQASASYRQQQPFGQVPVLEDGDVTLFESGSIVLHIAEKTTALLPKDAGARARARTWVFAALNSVEPSISNLTTIDLFEPDAEWAKLRRPAALEAVKKRLHNLDTWMSSHGNREFLEAEGFTAGDLMMTTVLRIPRHLDLLAKDFPRLDAYRQRCEARPGFAKALADQMRPFAENAPKA